MDNEARFLLDDTIAFCRRDGQDQRLLGMLEQCVPQGLDDESLHIAVPSRFAASYLERQRELIERYLEQIAFAPVHLDIAEAPDAMARPAEKPEAHEHQAPSPTVAESSTPVRQETAGATSEQQPATNRIPTAPKDGPVRVKTSVSTETWHRMMNELKGNEVSRKGSAPESVSPMAVMETTETERVDGYPAVDVNSKFTFDTFVFGDENRHAYQSSLRFAAFAEEPGQCTSLFIYGNSGLGKTHLLFAIKNYLAAAKPNLRVKYANSGTYLNDYMQELEQQNLQRQLDPSARKSSGGLIMSEYRDADILIIDDIQNIIGRTASIEFFFQLVDEFIRNGKKIAIASDRAPKDLGLDERLTSRFNAGMLCLVSAPGFEMKYAILKNYYENTICGAHVLTPEGEVPSLLSGMDLQQGRLSKEQLQHMAENSGNNIRELQGFCERCAGLSYEREQAGEELSAEDIDRIADEFFDTAHKVVRSSTILSVVEEFYHVSHDEIISKKRTKNIAFARHVAAYLANTMCEMSLKSVGAIFGRDHTTVIHSIEVIEKKEGEDARFREELRQLKNVILLKS